ncbi:hypothetical protein HEP87_60510 [Streptomyces sp. S1D4-11]|nr:hypothetical protein [Streptomyces sp. S1D4-11]
MHDREHLAITPKLIKDNRWAPAPKVFRIALYSWVYRFILGDD